MIDVDELFPERDEPDAAMTAAIAEVCAALGRAAQVTDARGDVETVIAGVRDGPRLAWVVKRWRDDGYEDIDGYTLHLADGARARTWEIETYNPWFGCEVGWLRWYGDELALIYAEKHHTLVAVLGFAGGPRLRIADHRWQVVGDHVLYASAARGLVERVRLPDLAVCVPLPAAEAADDLAAGTCRWPVPVPAPDAAEALWRRIAARLPAIDAALAELLIGALAYRFWAARPPVAGSYDDARAQAGDGWNTPCWLPFDWVRTRGGEAALAELAEVAARAPAACDAGEAAAELAARHIAARCGDLAAACRAGRLPEGTSCSFWVAWSQTEFAAALPLFPPGLATAWSALRGVADTLRR